MKSILSILFYLLVTFSLSIKAYSQQGKFRCDSLMVENHYSEKHWSFHHYYSNPNYDNTYGYYDLKLLHEQGKYKNDTSTFYYCNNVQCPIPINATSVTIKPYYEDTFTLDLSKNQNIIKIYINDEYSDTLFLYHLFNNLVQLKNLRTLRIELARRFIIPTNIKKLKQLEKLIIFCQGPTSGNRFDTIYYNDKKITNDCHFDKKKDFLKNYFIFKPLDELYELENLKNLAISTWGSLDINQTNLAKLQKLELVSLVADSIFYLKDDLFSKNNIQHINLLWYKPEYIERQEDKSKKIIYFNSLPKCLISANHSLKTFNCTFLKITDNLADLSKLTHLVSLQTNILDLKNHSNYSQDYWFENLKELTFYSPEDFPYPTYKGKIGKSNYNSNFRFNKLNKLTFIGQFPKKPHFLRRVFLSNSKIKDIELIEFEGDFLQFLEWSKQYKDVNLKIISTDINKLYESVERGSLRYIPKFNKISFLYDDLIDCKAENLVRIKCDTLEITYYESETYNENRNGNIIPHPFEWKRPLVWDELSKKAENGKDKKMPSFWVTTLQELPNVKTVVFKRAERNYSINYQYYYEPYNWKEHEFEK
ncbi:MAG: hypothetical protein ACOYMA_17540 [Bacteroidia bacterium]